MEGALSDFYNQNESSLSVQSYDAFHSTELLEETLDYTRGEIEFYLEMAREIGEPILELGCGTGRVTLPLAEGGLHVTGVDYSEGMLSIARHKAAARPTEIQQRLTLILQDVTKLDLDGKFRFAFFPYRSFQYILTCVQQKAALNSVRNCLEPKGLLVLDLYDPTPALLFDRDMPFTPPVAVNKWTGQRYFREIMDVSFDRVEQTRSNLWRIVEIGPDGEELREEKRLVVHRWTYRWELRHLLEFCGFTIEAEYSDFARSSPAYGKGLIVVARSG